MLEFLIYVVVLGLSAGLIVPFVWGFVKGMLPAQYSASVSLPSGYPTTVEGILWTVLVWGLLLAGALYAVSFIGPIDKALRMES